MKKICWAIVAAVSLVGCGEEGEAKKAVLDGLKDPDSAKFGEFSLAGKKYACFTVNAKNSMGGYIGYQQARLRKIDNKWVMYMMVNESHEECVNYLLERDAKD